MKKYISIIPTKEILNLFNYIKEHDSEIYEEVDRKSIFERALDVAIKSDSNYKKVIEYKKFLKSDSEIKLPSSFKIEIKNDDINKKYKTVVENIKKQFNIAKVQNRYVIKILLLNYIYSKRNNQFDLYIELKNVIESWISYNENAPKCEYRGNEIVHDIYRAMNDRDCILTNGNLMADTIISLWNPLKMIIEEINTGVKVYKKNTKVEENKAIDINLFLKMIKNDMEKLLPLNDKLVERYLYLVQLGVTRANVMILPNRIMQNRGYFYLDQLPKTLYECFPGGRYYALFDNNEDKVISWIQEEHLEICFYENNITREAIIPLTSEMKEDEFRWMKGRKEIEGMIEYSINVLEYRSKYFSSCY